MKRSARMIIAIIAVGFMATMAQGCVAQNRYDAMEDDYNMMKERMFAAERDANRMKSDGTKDHLLASLQTEIENLRGQIAAYDAAINARDNVLQNALAKIKQMDGDHAKALLANRKELEALRKRITSTGLTATIEGNMVRIDVPSDLLFNSGSNDLRDDVKKSLAQLAGILKTDAAKVRIDGHTDNVPLVKTKGRWGDNLFLSLARAHSVASYLKTVGVEKKIVSASGYGEYKPIADNVDKAGQKKNRRVEIFIQPKGKQS